MINNKPAYLTKAPKIPYSQTSERSNSKIEISRLANAISYFLSSRTLRKYVLSILPLEINIYA